MAAEKSRILVIGATGFMGRYVVHPAARLGHPTFALVRQSTAASNPEKAELIEGFKRAGVNIIYGDINDHESLVKAIRQVDVVIALVSDDQVTEQTKIIAAIKEAGNVKRFFPSEFAIDWDHLHAVGPAKSILEVKTKFRRIVESAGIPYTMVCSNSLPEIFLLVGQYVAPVGEPGFPEGEAVILGDGNTKAIFVTGEDLGTYTIKAADDPRTTNKILYMRPPANILSHNEIVSIWEKKTGKTMKRVYIPEEKALKLIQEAPMPWSYWLAITYSIFIEGDETNFEIEPSFGVEASELYPDVKYATMEELMNKYV